MVVNLYVSKVVLNALGVDDFGIYNVVAGVVSMFYIVAASITVTISRFITFSLGKGSEDSVSEVFSAAVNIQVCTVIFIVLLAETAGLWFLNNKLTIPSDRLYASNIIYQFALAAFAVNLLSIPYNALIIAHEKMGAYAYISLFDGLFKLLVAFLLSYSPGDRLVFYGGALALSVVVQRIIYGVYCRRVFPECRYRFGIDWMVLKRMFSYAGWTYIGTSSALLRDQGSNILVNIYFGPVANAAKAISQQVQSAVGNFALNFTTALNPQIIKNYASGNFARVGFLLVFGSLISYYLLLIVVLPIFLNAPYILKLWLGIVPEYTVIFVQLSLLFVLSESLSNPLMTAVSASGNIRGYQLVVGGIQSLNFPVSYLLLHFGLQPQCVLVAAIVLSQACMFARLLFARRLAGLSIGTFLRKCYFRVLLVTILSAVLPVVSGCYMSSNFRDLAVSCAVCVLSSAIVVYAAGFSREERVFIDKKIASFYRKIRKVL